MRFRHLFMKILTISVTYKLTFSLRHTVCYSTKHSVQWQVMCSFSFFYNNLFYYQDPENTEKQSELHSSIVSFYKDISQIICSLQGRDEVSITCYVHTWIYILLHECTIYRKSMRVCSIATSHWLTLSLFCFKRCSTCSYSQTISSLKET